MEIVSNVINFPSHSNNYHFHAAEIFALIQYSNTVEVIYINRQCREKDARFNNKIIKYMLQGVHSYLYL